MYDETWFNYVADHIGIDSTSSNSERSSWRKSLVNKPDVLKPSDPSDTARVISLELQQPNCPLTPSIARRSKSHNDLCKNNNLSKVTDTLFFPASSKESKLSHHGSGTCPTNYLMGHFENFEHELINHNLEEYKLYHDHLALSERHLDRILVDTTSALDLLATLSLSFKSVESETVACQLHCEDMLAEQKRLMILTNEVGTTLQYFSFLEPLTKRLNAAGARRLVTSEDFLDMLLNLNCCIEFMETHPNYRDSLSYKTKYISLLDRSLDLVQKVFSSAFKDVTEEVIKELRIKDHNETSEFILLYGRYETIQAKLGSQFERLLKTEDFVFGKNNDGKNTSAYVQHYHDLWHGILEVYTKNREAVTWRVAENLKNFIATRKPETDFQAFARHAVLYVIDICHNEQNLIMRNFQGGPLLADYGTSDGWQTNTNYSVKLEELVYSHLKSLHSIISPYLDNDNLERICGLVNWLETFCFISADDLYDLDTSINDQAVIGKAYLSKYLWKSMDDIFIKAAMKIRLHKPSAEELDVYRVSTMNFNSSSSKQSTGDGAGRSFENHGKNLISSAYPTVKRAVELMVSYNDGLADRPRNNNVSYEIVHQTTKSLQMAATLINRSSGMMDAQLFLIKNLMLIENLLMTNEVPDSVRRSAEFDFSPIWSTITELYAQKKLFNPLALITPLVRGKLLPRVVDRVLDARKDLERILVQQITAFTKTWQTKLSGQDKIGREDVEKELGILLSHVFEDEITRAALWKMVLGDQKN